MWDSSLFHELSWKVSYFQFSINFQFRYEIQVFFLCFHEIISKFKSWSFSKFRCEIQVYFMRFHEKYRTFNFQSFSSSDMWFKYFSCAFMKKYRNLKVDCFLSSDVRFKSISWALMKSIVLSIFNQFPVQIWDSSIFFVLSWNNIEI